MKRTDIFAFPTDTLARTALAALVVAAGAGCAPSQKLILTDTPNGPAPRLVRIVESVEGRGTTTIEWADESSPEQQKYAGFFDAFGRMEPKACTATHLGDGVVLTAGHCLTDEPADKIPRFQRVLDDRSCNATHNGKSRKVRVKWGDRAGQIPYLLSSCSRIVAWEWTEERDFAVLIVARDRGGQLPRAFLPLGPALPEETITLFSHAGGSELKWSGLCKLGVPAGGPDPFFFHTCTTDGGSSGAAILDDVGRVVGLHLGQWGEKGPNYAMFTADPIVAEHLRRAFVQAAQPTIPNQPPKTAL